MKKIHIVTSRFNDATWSQNIEFRAKHNLIGCVYGTPLQITQRIPLNSIVFVVEMNNSINKIEGIGLIKNFIQVNKKYCVYEIGNYNRYIYGSDYHINRTEIESYNPELVRILDHILFKEKTHLKRGSGLTSLPDKLLRHRLCSEIKIEEELCQLFRNIYLEKTK